MADATTLTEAGYVGEDVENIILNYYKQQITMLKKLKEELFILMKLTKLVENQKIHQLLEMYLVKVFNKLY